MNAIILAAGIGSRLRPLTEKKPKTMVQVNGIPMIGHIANALAQANVERVVICTGYHAESIKAYFRQNPYKGEIIFVDNPDFLTTNNMYSLYLAKDYLTGDCLLMNADLVFDPGIIQDLVKAPHTSFAVDVGRYIEESMKVVVENGRIRHISKKITPSESYGCSIDVYKINAADTSLLIDEMSAIIDKAADKKQWTEVMLDSLCSSGRLAPAPLPIGKNRWFEIDNFEDLAHAEILFNKHIPELKRRRLFFFDKDGTISIGLRPLPGAVDALDKITKLGKQWFLLTNNSSKTPDAHHQALTKAGFHINKEQVLVSIDAAIGHLKQNNLLKIHWLASDDVAAYLASKGLSFEDKKPDALLLTYDTTLTYEKLVSFTRHLRTGIPYFATHTDIVCPTPDGTIPDIGTFIETLRLTTQRTPGKTFGKPNPAIIQPTLGKNKAAMSDAVIIGDRTYTDLALAQGTDLLSVLVLTGETTRTDYEEQPFRADIILPGITALANLLDGTSTQ